jgi:hypothetical protein
VTGDVFQGTTSAVNPGWVPSSSGGGGVKPLLGLAISP